MAEQSWEPWTPQLGQRVRVRLSGECREHFTAYQDDTPYFRPVPHYAEEDGRVGAVTEVRQDEQGHRFYVDFEEPFRLRRRYELFRGWVSPRLMGACYAAIELEPLGATDA